ncbi:hypothetical protein BEL07_28995 [Mycolicibacterium grossiae]|uniref:Uncharacterized protein n=1 Tax=Mycolicibacterium grossiae TaxID=1552759 RepID=A0A1E8PXA1_9MYCO|nr:hypothetical protein BEL07_28995 [Mycolicibacterium grossiae]
MLDDVEVAFDDVAALVVFGIEGWWSPALGATTFAVADLIGRFGNDCDDPSSSQPLSSRSAGIGLVATQAIRPRAWPPPTAALGFQVGEQMLQNRSVVGLASAHEHDQRSSVAVDEVMDLAGQSAAGAANAVVRRLAGQICVIRPSPLCHG